YSATFKLFLIVSLLVQSINLVFSPWIVESKNKSFFKRKQLFFNLLGGYMLIGVFAGIFLFLFGPYIMKLLFGERFAETQNLIIIFSFVLTPILPIHLLLSSYMNNFEKDKQFFLGSLLQSILTLISLPVFLFLFGLYGAIYGLGLSVFVVTAYYFRCLHRE